MTSLLRRIAAPLLLALATVSTATPVEAQVGSEEEPPPPPAQGEREEEEEEEEEAEAEWPDGRPIVAADTYPVAFTQRPINLPDNMIRLDGELVISHYALVSNFDMTDDPKAFVGFNVGAGFGITDELEAGVSGYRMVGHRPFTYQGAVPLAFNPNVDIGDIRIYSRYAAVAEPEFDLSIDVGFVIPIDTDFALHASVPMRARLSDRFIIDAAAEFVLEFDAVAREDRGLSMPEDGTLISFLVPVKGVLQIVDSFYIAGQGGVDLIEFDFDLFTLPLGFEAGYTINDGAAPFLDIVAGFHWPRFLTPQQTDDVNEDVWQVTLTLNGYFQL